jgi:hypothetical protein
MLSILPLNQPPNFGLRDVVNAVLGTGRCVQKPSLIQQTLSNRTRLNGCAVAVRTVCSYIASINEEGIAVSVAKTSLC